MKHVSILVPHGNVISDTIIGAYNLFTMANNRYRKQHKTSEDLFKVDLVGASREAENYTSFLSITPSKGIDEIEKTDLIIIPGLVGNMKAQVDLNEDFIKWMRDQRVKHQTEIASLCRGAFLLAKTGLMHGKSCATHWLTHDTFRDMFPDVDLVPDKVVSEDNGIYSSGGAYSFLNLLLHLIEKNYGREIAIWCAKVSEIEFDREDQNQFVIFRGQKDHSDAQIAELQDYIEENYAGTLRVEQLAERIATSGRNLVRRFKKATHNTPIEYIQRVRIEAAKRALESTSKHVHEVMYDCGYNDDKTFRTIFKRYAGITPLEYRSKYNREMIYT